MPSKGRDVIVIGTAAGGLEALDQLIGQLPTDLPASIVIVQHMDPGNSGEPLLRRLGRHQAFHPKLAEDGERLKPTRIYIAPPDNHLLIKKGKMLVTKGAAENRHRPGIDPLFRSAAVSHGSRVIGVVLTGMMDDGTAGLIAVKRCGGVKVIARRQLAEVLVASLTSDGRCAKASNSSPPKARHNTTLMRSSRGSMRTRRARWTRFTT